MERNFYNDDFEQLLKEQSDEFRMYPSKRVWHSIYNDLHPGRKWPSVAVTMFLIIALFMTGYWNSNYNSSVQGSKIAAILSAAPSPSNDKVSTAASSYNPASIDNTSKATVNIPAKESINTIKYNLPASGPKNNRRTIIATAEKNSTPDNANGTVPGEEAINEMSLTGDGKTAVIITAPVIEEKEIATMPAETQTIDITSLATQSNLVDASRTVNLTAAKETLPAEDKSFIEDYAFHNKAKRKPWKDRSTLDFYLTPNVTYRELSNDSKYNLPSALNSFSATSPGAYANNAVDQRPGLGLEAGLGITYSVGKNFRVKAGLQANYTNYGVNADETNHPVLTTLMFVDPVTDYSYLSSSSSTLSNSSGLQPVRVHNKTYQLSMPLGMAFKIMGNEKLEFYAGASLQPTVVLGGKANLISADRKNYVSDPSLIRRWNLNTGFETYINYKLDGFTLQAGPQFRYQLFSTYDRKYTVNENLYGMGIKVGILKNF